MRSIRLTRTHPGFAAAPVKTSLSGRSIARSAMRNRMRRMLAGSAMRCRYVAAHTPVAGKAPPMAVGKSNRLDTAHSDRQMSAEDFDAGMKTCGIRIAKAVRHVGRQIETGIQTEGADQNRVIVSALRESRVCVFRRASFLHRSDNDDGGRALPSGYCLITPSSRPIRANASIARSRCSRVCAALIWVRMRAWPFATTGNKNPIA